MSELEQMNRPAPVLDVRQRLQCRPAGEAEHRHGARGIRVQAANAGPDRLHYHRSTAGITEQAPNRPGHRHLLPNGQWTDGSSERWSSTGIRRL